MHHIDAQTQHTVIVKGAMKDAMWKGEIEGKIAIDTITDQENLFGIGPIEFISGEIMVVNGKIYSSRVVSKNEMKVLEGEELKAPFFVYANVPEWEEIEFPGELRTMSELENFLVELKTDQPFAFRIEGFMDTAIIHVVNLPAGKKISSPEEAHEGKTTFEVIAKPFNIVGFFSTKHQGIFTHHNSFLHMHLITLDREMMGHVDDMVFSGGKIRVYIPRDLIQE